jgi:GNAT superfamily N-acetyltransferase
VTPDDKPLFERGLSELSAATRQKRFLSSVERLNEEQLRYLTEIDYVNHVAWGGVDARQPRRRGLGVARYIRLEEDPMVAEVAVAVIDDFQRKGLGTLLLVVLAASATANGIETFFAHVGGGNSAVLRMVPELGGRVQTVESGLAEVKVPLLKNPADLPDTPSGKRFKKAARQLGRSYASSLSGG